MPLIDRRCVVRLAVFFFVLMSLMPAYVAADITHNLVGWWRLDEGTSTVVHDSSGYGNNGRSCVFSLSSDACTTLTSSVWATGKYGSAFSSTLANPTMVMIASSTNISLNATTTGTVAAWVKLNSYSTWQPLVCKENLAGNPRNGYALRLDNSSPAHPLSDLANGSGTFDSHAFNATVPLGQWVHIAYTWNGATYNQYFNGAVDQSGLAETAVPTPAGSIFYIGKCGGDLTDDLDGAIDDVRVYTRTLSASDIAQLVAETQSVMRKPANMLGMIAWYKFDEGTSTIAHDSSTFGYNGTTSATSSAVALPQWTNGKFGKALQFDGVSGYVNTNILANKLASGSFTISEWFKLAVPITAANPGPPQVLFSLSDPSSGNDVFLNFGNIPSATGVDGELSGQELTPTMFQASTATQTDWPANTWYHVVYTFDTTAGGKLYLNGVLSGSNSANTRGTATSKHAAIGGNSGFGGSSIYSFNGAIDDVRIYNRALSAYEVANLYNSGGAAKVASAADLQNGSSLTNSLIAHYTFDGKDTPWSSATNVTAIDSSGNGNNASSTTMNRSTSPTIGKIGQALLFNSTSYVQLPQNGFTTGPHPWTLAAWVKPTSYANFDGNAHYIAQYDSTGVANGTPVILLDVGGSPEVSSFLGTPSNDCPSATAAVLGKWIHIVGEYDGTNEVLYVNGKLDRTCTGITSNIVMTNPPLIGDNSGGSFQGSIDDVRIYNRALTATEIKQLYKLGQATLHP